MTFEVVISSGTKSWILELDQLASPYPSNFSTGKLSGFPVASFFFGRGQPPASEHAIGHYYPENNGSAEHNKKPKILRLPPFEK